MEEDRVKRREKFSVKEKQCHVCNILVFCAWSFMVREHFFISPTHRLIFETDGWVGAFEVTSNYWSV